jgi:hypothetical protein
MEDGAGFEASRERFPRQRGEIHEPRTGMGAVEQARLGSRRGPDAGIVRPRDGRGQEADPEPEPESGAFADADLNAHAEPGAFADADPDAEPATDLGAAPRLDAGSRSAARR